VAISLATQLNAYNKTSQIALLGKRLVITAAEAERYLSAADR
jgi:hypothetical protein